MAKSWVERMEKAKKPETLVGKITARIEELAPEMERLKVLRQEMEDMKAALELHANEVYEDSSEVSFINDSVEVDFSPRTLVRRIKDMPGLMKHLGKEVFFKHVTFPLKELDAYVPKAEQKKFVQSRRIGPRSCRIKLID